MSNQLILQAYEKQAFQQSNQFNMSSSQQNAANLSSAYGAPYLLPHQQQQAMQHHGSMGSSVVDQGQQSQQQQAGNGNGAQQNRSMQGSNQAHKGASAAASVGNQQSYKQAFNWN